MGSPSIPDWILWILPVLFFIHDLEETLFLIPWIRRNRTKLTQRFPKLSGSLLSHFDKLTPTLFAAMAAEELLLLVAVTLYAVLSDDLLPWIALFLAFTIHLLVHVGQWIAVRSYIPVIGTTLLCLPCCGYVIKMIVRQGNFSAGQILLCAAVGCAVAALNLLLIHRLAVRSTSQP